MEDEAQAKILQFLDVIFVEVAANRGERSSLRSELHLETSSLRDEMRAGFGRVERRLGNLENRVKDVETELRVVQTDLQFGSALSERKTQQNAGFFHILSER
jgi:hypothetical protein